MIANVSINQHELVQEVCKFARGYYRINDAFNSWKRHASKRDDDIAITGLTNVLVGEYEVAKYKGHPIFNKDGFDLMDKAIKRLFDGWEKSGK